jgi:sugar lactone lactonase YvrE
MRRLTFLATLFVCFTLLFGMVVPALADSGDISLIASGLNNPRGLNFGPDGRLYVAEAGAGGDGLCAPGPEGPRCYGDSSSITVIDLKKSSQERIVEGLPSLGGQGTGDFASGIQDVSFQGMGGMYFSIGYGGDPALRVTQFGSGGAALDQLAQAVPSGNWGLTTDLGDFEISSNPTGDEVDSNPYGVLALPGKTVVADAGANDLLQINANGKISVLATFPNRMVDAPPFLGLPPGTQIPMDQVPTTVALGPDGYYYVGTLTGFPFPVNSAIVYRVPADGGTPEVYATGLTHIIDIAFGPDGSLYILEIAKNGLLAAFGGGDWTGALIRVAPDGTQTEIASQGLFAPGGVAIGPDGAFYVTNNSISAGAGEVLRIEP